MSTSIDPHSAEGRHRNDLACDRICKPRSGDQREHDLSPIDRNLCDVDSPMSWNAVRAPLMSLKSMGGNGKVMTRP
jgi:hypothetical protein